MRPWIRPPDRHRQIMLTYSNKSLYLRFTSYHLYRPGKMGPENRMGIGINHFSAFRSRQTLSSRSLSILFCRATALGRLRLASCSQQLRGQYARRRTFHRPVARQDGPGSARHKKKLTQTGECFAANTLSGSGVAG